MLLRIRLTLQTVLEGFISHAFIHCITPRSAYKCHTIYAHHAFSKDIVYSISPLNHTLLLAFSVRQYCPECYTTKTATATERRPSNCYNPSILIIPLTYLHAHTCRVPPASLCSRASSRTWSRQQAQRQREEAQNICRVERQLVHNINRFSLLRCYTSRSLGRHPRDCALDRALNHALSPQCSPVLPDNLPIVRRSLNRS
ncbi:hypothetical protein BD309DRAFT_963065 [Dichomitus squalens]|uniref:Uncharacterized protein n=1 Tax=Dichomitus squalens TaxID=114155 RepID=A0A4V2K8U9_9APHY|nr:hypothetical protein BD309DRAFT_963065 [Dichomitus squalens]TBU61388.1 hypothetical protein BD310DRAFT_920667 [Dichomitus squalens]